MLMKLLFIYLVAINFVAFIVYGIDKRKAIYGKWRIRESHLLGIAFCGGSLGAMLGMKFFRHKTRVTAFKVGVPLMLCLHVALMLFLMFF